MLYVIRKSTRDIPASSAALPDDTLPNSNILSAAINRILLFQLSVDQVDGIRKAGRLFEFKFMGTSNHDIILKLGGYGQYSMGKRQGTETDTFSPTCHINYRLCRAKCLLSAPCPCSRKSNRVTFILMA